ncbi:site-specific integrase [Methylomonas montana]|uniref:tyrosine-type recombinase/integrase n=1 Tax=Methylomonas montana TaxID=3058963 RepID=UPI0026590D27|nr:site-specific integrase [Methylomonas montana]WKJ90320.1 site-specific integrase [Methylomonas montana]
MLQMTLTLATNAKRKKQVQQIENENQKRIDAGLPVIGSFGEVALEFFEKKMQTKSDSHRKRTWRVIDNDLMPWLKHRPINEIKAPKLLDVLRRIETRTVEMSHRALQASGQIFRYGVATGRCEQDITQSHKGALASKQTTHFSALTDTRQLGGLLRAIDEYSGSFVVKSALMLAPLVFVRPGELRGLEWQHIDFDTAEWRYLVTKTDTQHIVPLSRQAVDVLRNLYPLTGGGRFAFPSARTPNGSRSISDMALLAALRRMGFDKSEMTVHGFRAIARTLLDEVLGFRLDFIEHQLAHAVRDPNGRAYNRTAHLEERRKMMQSWADYLGSLKAGAQVIPFPATA